MVVHRQSRGLKKVETCCFRSASQLPCGISSSETLNRDADSDRLGRNQTPESVIRIETYRSTSDNCRTVCKISQAHVDFNAVTNLLIVADTTQRKEKLKSDCQGRYRFHLSSLVLKLLSVSAVGVTLRCPWLIETGLWPPCFSSNTQILTAQGSSTVRF